METFIISDTHFGHENIIQYANRPFESVKHMNEELIERWNSVVSPKDRVIHLGDVTFNYGLCYGILQKLNGTKHLILGNHDNKVVFLRAAGFEPVVNNRAELFCEVINGTTFYMVHKPGHMPKWDGDDTIIRLVGHEHNNAPPFIDIYKDKRILALNMSCEYWDYRPAHIDDIIDTYKRFLPHFI